MTHPQDSDLEVQHLPSGVVARGFRPGELTLARWPHTLPQPLGPRAGSPGLWVAQPCILAARGTLTPLYFGAQLSFHLYNRVFWLEAKCPLQVTAIKIGNLINFVA